MACILSEFNEGDDGAIEMVFTDEFGNSVTPTSVKYTLYDEKTKDILNGREDVDLGSPASTMHLLLTPEDNVIHNATSVDEEIHVVEVEFVYTSNLGPGRIRRKPYRFIVKNLVKVS
jgi:hypothetical protein